MKKFPQQEIALRQVALQPLAKRGRRQNILHSHTVASGLIGVRWANPPPGGADLAAASQGLPSGVQQAVVGQRDVCFGADEQASPKVDAAGVQFLHLFHQGFGVDHHPRADNATHAGVQHAGGNLVEDVLLIVDNDSVSGIGATLAADDPLHLRGQHVDDFAFPFVAPLNAHNRHNCH